jgi:hypothetical protein
MSTSRRRPARLPVRINPSLWVEEVERLVSNSPARAAADRERRSLERDGIDLTLLAPCEPEGAQGTRLGGLVKSYVPTGAGPPSEQPFGFVFSAERDEQGPYLELVAFGERHPPRGTRSVYERAHKRLHGRYPDE